jgi:hypothetical protein
MALHEAMGVVPADAMNEGVWSFVTLVVAPELAVWRFGIGNDDRFLGKPRNTFRRLWMRVEALGRDLFLAGLDGALGEDELVQIMERTNLSANRRLARAMAAALMNVEAGVPRSPLMRDFSKRIRRKVPVIALDCLDDAQLGDLVAGAMELSVRFMSRM